MSLQTCNYYRGAVRQFSRWLSRDGRVRDDVLAYLPGYNASTDRRRERRSLSAVELQMLVEITKHGSTWHGMTGTERAMLYHVATGTGFRAAELRSLTRTSFHLDGDPPAVALRAADSKRRRSDLQPIRLTWPTHCGVGWLTNPRINLCSHPCRRRRPR